MKSNKGIIRGQDIRRRGEDGILRKKRVITCMRGTANVGKKGDYDNKTLIYRHLLCRDKGAQLKTDVNRNMLKRE